ncbi:MAG: extracellular solute-binding protein [Clostridium sp.]
MKRLLLRGVSIIFIITVVGILISGNNKDLKGNINILVSSSSKEYIEEMANEFMIRNEKVRISIQTEYDNGYSKKVKESIHNDINLIEIDTIDLHMLMQLEDKFNDNDEIIETYKNNFTVGRINEVNFSQKIKGMPLTSRPIVLYVREDLMNQYGYDKSSINTWDDVIRIGEDIFSKSYGEVKLINATGQDLKDLISILVMQEIESDEKSEEEALKEVTNFIYLLNRKNIINVVDGGGFAIRISSINGMRELAAINEQCEWVATYPPSKLLGGNKFYVAEGSNFVIVNNNYNKSEIVEEFLEYLTSNSDKVIKYAREGAFFPSYLYAYKDKKIEQEINNFIGRSPLVVMDNIIRKAPPINNYQLYRDIKLRVTTDY